MYALYQLLLLLVDELPDLLTAATDDALHALRVTLGLGHQRLDSVDVRVGLVPATVDLIKSILVLIHDFICRISKRRF